MTAQDGPAFPLSPRPTVIFTGAFGSGKTEVAVSYALAAVRQGRRTCLLDFDIVTPYFRVGDYRKELENRGLQVVAPEGALSGFEMPAVSPRVASVLREVGVHAVLDVGGDPVGARLLAVYSGAIAARGYDMFVVANPNRPSTGSAAAIAEQARRIAGGSELAVTGLVANPNLGSMTSATHVTEGLRLVEKAAESLGVPVVFVAVEENLARRELGISRPVLPMRLLVRLPWEAR